MRQDARCTETSVSITYISCLKENYASDNKRSVMSLKNIGGLGVVDESFGACI